MSWAINSGYECLSRLSPSFIVFKVGQAILTLPNDKIGINGFGRLGRAIFCTAYVQIYSRTSRSYSRLGHLSYNTPYINVVAVNDPNVDAAQAVRSTLKYTSIRLPRHVLSVFSQIFLRKPSSKKSTPKASWAQVPASKSTQKLQTTNSCSKTPPRARPRRCSSARRMIPQSWAGALSALSTLSSAPVCS